MLNLKLVIMNIMTVRHKYAIAYIILLNNYSNVEVETRYYEYHDSQT